MPDSPARRITEREFEPAQIAAIAAAIICISVAGIGLSLATPLISLLLSAQGVSATTIGFIMAAGSFASLVISPFVPRLAMLFGLRNFVLINLALAAASLCLFPLLASLTAWLVLRSLFSIAIGNLFVLSEYWINASAPSARRGLTMGIYATALSIGSAGGPALLVASGGATPVLFPVGAAFFAVAALPLFFAGKDAPPLEGKSTLSIWRFVFLAPVATAAAFVYGVVEQGSFTFLSLYGEAIRFSQSDSALLLVSFGLGNVVSQVPLGLLSDRISRPILLMACALATMTGALLMPLASADLHLLMGIVFVTGGMAGGLYTIGLAHLGAHFSGTALATANAAFIMLYVLGMMAGTPVFGVVVDTIRPHGFAFGLAFVCAAYVLLVAGRLRTRAS